MSEEDNYYPLLEDINFNYKLQNHPEFYKYKTESDNYILEVMKQKSLEKCNNSGGYIFKNIQMFISTFLSLNTPYNGVLLYHGVGVGKTCTSILISDNFKNYVKKHKKKIIILTKPTVKDGFRNEIFKFNNNNVDKNQFICTSSEYSNEYEDFIKNNKDLDNKKINEFTSGIINETYEIYGYLEFVNKYEHLIKNDNNEFNQDKINEIFSNCVFIIDEIHNLREENEGEESDEMIKEKTIAKKSAETKKSRNIIENIIRNLREPIKLILLSATPMYDKYEEIDFIINLLLLNDKKKTLLDRKTIDSYVNNMDDTSKQSIIEKTTGYISYIKGNDPHIFPLILYPENNSKIIYNTPNGDINSEKINAILCNMDSFQKQIYDLGNTHTKRKKYSNVVFPENKTFTNLFTPIDKKGNNKYSFNKDTPELCLTFLKNIQDYSIKIKSLIDNLENSTGKVFIYSEYKQGDYGGTYLLGIILQYYGYIRKTINNKKLNIDPILDNKYSNNSEYTKQPKYYIMVDGSTSEDDFTAYKNIFNSDNNIEGNIIKIIIGTTNMIEGVSLNNVRQIHIMQPWYNISRNDQIVGRGVRQCSHIKLPFNMRNITIFNYVAISTDLEQYNNQTYIVPYIDDKKSSIKQDIDLRRLYLATEKINKITLLENLLKSNSVDCLLNKNINNIQIINLPKDRPNEIKTDSIIQHIDSFNNIQLISYEKIDNINCNIEDNPTSNTLFNYQSKAFMNKNLKKNTKYFIKKIFTMGVLRKSQNNELTVYQTNKIYFSYNELFEELKLYNSQIDEDLYKISLQDLILNKEIFYNIFNNPGYIILKGVYLIFKSSNFENINLPSEFISYPFNNKINNINNYFHYLINTNLKPKTTKSTEKTITKLAQKDISDTQSKSTTIEQTLSKNQQVINDLLEACKKNGLITSLQEPDLFTKYQNLWTKLKPNTEKKKNGLVLYDKNNIDLDTDLDSVRKSQLYSSVSKTLFKIDISPIDIETQNTLKIFYNNYYNIHFIFNYSIIIVTYLKCLFYRVHIKNVELNKKEQQIYDYYKYLIQSETPLVFKFVDFFKNELNIYNYNYLGLIYYEFKNDQWITHNISYTNNTETKNNFTFYKIFPSVINKKISKFLVDKQFIMEQLKIDQFDYDRIYKTFDLNNYYNHNNTYFIYSGDPNEPRKVDVSDSTKLSNITGIIMINSSDSKSSLNDLSRNIFTLGTIYSIHHQNNTNYYLKTASNTGYNNIIIDTQKIKGITVGINKIKHVIYCILDQVEELNYKILLEIVLNSDINYLWYNEEIKFKFEIKQLFLNIDFSNPELTQENYNELNTYLTNLDEFNKVLLDLDIINKNLNDYKYKFYLNYKSIYNILNTKKKLDESVLVSLTSYLLYDLDNYKKNDSYRSFYNKRWLFNLLESSLLNTKLLDIDLVSSSTLTDKPRIADSASFTSNTFILSKKWSSMDKFISLDSKN